MKRPALTFAVLTWRSGYVLKMLLPPTARRTPLDSSYERSRSASVLARSEEHTSELQSWLHLVCRLLLEKKNTDDHRLRQLDPVVALAPKDGAARLHHLRREAHHHVPPRCHPRVRASAIVCNHEPSQAFH